MGLMRIKEISQKLKITPRAIRFYEEKGLIAPRKKEDNQYREFEERDALRLQTIIALREVGMSIEDIKRVLDEFDQGDPDDIHYFLELQRSVMFSQWVEIKQIIRTLDQMIEILRQKQTVAIEDIYRLAEGCKRLRDSRKNWRDRWNFDRQAHSYDERVLKGNYGLHIHMKYEEALELTLQWVAPREGEVGLDIGTGTGNLAGKFLAKGIRMAGIDQSREMLKQCRKKYPQMETKLGNALAIPYLDDQFDFAVSSYALHHLSDEQKLLALEEIKRVLKPHGRICITDLMFENQEKRREYIDNLKKKGDFDLIEAIEDEYYADRSLLLKWFEENDYLTKCQQVTDLLHIVLAVPIR